MMEIGKSELQIVGASEAIRPSDGDLCGKLLMEVAQGDQIEKETNVTDDAPRSMAVMDVQTSLGVEERRRIQIDGR